MNRTARAAGDLILAGPMGAGKTSIGQLVAGWLDRDFVDLDALIVARESKSIPELFADGEEVFRRAEREALRWWLERGADAPAELLALGGGTLEDAELAESLGRRGTIVHLDAPADALAARLDEPGRTVRPLLSGASDPAVRLSELRQARAAGYARAAAFSVATEGVSVTHAGVRLLRRLYDATDGPWRTRSERLVPADASVTIGRGAMPELPTSRAVLLIDETLPCVQREWVDAYLGASARGGVVRLTRAGGEPAKSPESLLGAWRELLEAGIDAATPLWVVGGGSLSDLGGLVAHTFKRGLPLTVIPTTLLAQLDAALGGKNAVNLDGVKNVIGTIRLPERVHLDALYLLTLPDAELRAGLSEAVKSALVGDPELLTQMQRSIEGIRARRLTALETVTRRAARVKQRIVTEDLYDVGERWQLNFGHTFGHALEAVAATQGEPMAHGDAVAVGMLFAVRLSARLRALEDSSLESRLRALLTELGLPTAPPPPLLADKERLMRALSHDKKRRTGTNTFMLIRKAGRLIPVEVGTTAVEQVVESFR
ncbi:MAG: bifunctional shikimate kinase/3-dehydroquinate synthase [Acidobacteriota bacterium]|nr:MAG: bifunctional shikimate kinase/3-dehydroquinate synthase [Acidobacteriota bacterium]